MDVSAAPPAAGLTRSADVPTRPAVLLTQPAMEAPAAVRRADGRRRRQRSAPLLGAASVNRRLGDVAAEDQFAQPGRGDVVGREPQQIDGCAQRLKRVRAHRRSSPPPGLKARGAHGGADERLPMGGRERPVPGGSPPSRTQAAEGPAMT